MAADLTLNQVLGSLECGLLACDARARIAFANQAVREMLQIGQSRIIGRDIAQLLPGVAGLVTECLATGKAQAGPRVGEGEFRLTVEVYPIRDHGRISGASCVLRPANDLEPAGRGPASFEDLHEQLNAVFELSSEGIWLIDGQGRILRINKAAESFIGAKAEDLVGRETQDLVDEGLIDYSATLQVLAEKRQIHMIQVIKRTKRHLLLTATPLFDPQGRISMVVINERDITQLHTLREQLQQSRMITEKYKDELAGLSMQELRKERFVGESREMKRVLDTAFKLATMEVSNILLLGESGTGKGLLAKYIHDSSTRREKPFIQINFAAVPESLLEAELFGYESGAFTGASQVGKAGLFELAQGGTLFLDEIGEASLLAQAKILKYLDDKQVIRVGGTKSRTIDCAIIAATNRDLETASKAGEFRRDLFFRLNTFILAIPPLRERREDIAALVGYYLQRYNNQYSLNCRISPRGLKALESHPFSGNVRELKGLIKSAAVLSRDEILDDYLIQRLSRARSLGFPSETGRVGPLKKTLGRVEREILAEAVQRCGTTRELARLLGISQATAVRKLNKYGLTTKLIQ